jgi:hydrogenase 3 maturation protease
MLADRGLEGVVDSGVAPELDTWRIRELRPDNVLFVDAVDFGGKPGEVTLLAPADLRKIGFDTHRAPLKLTMEYLERDLGCKCYVLAIQPRDVRQGAPMCSEVKRSAANLVEVLVEACRAGVGDRGR